MAAVAPMILSRHASFQEELRKTSGIDAKSGTQSRVECS